MWANKKQLAWKEDVSGGLAAVTETYPVADGVNIQAGDVVDIVDGKVTKSYTTKIQLSKYKNWANGVASAKVTNNLSVIMIYRGVSTENYILLIDNDSGEIISSCQYYNGSGINNIKIVRVKDNAVAAFFRYDSSWYCTLCTITNNVIETTLQNFRVTGLDCLDVLPYDQNTILMFQANSGASDTTGKLGCGILRINDQFNTISTNFVYELSSSAQVRFASSCIIESSGKQKIFIAYNLNSTNSKLYYMIGEYNNGTINIIKAETQYGSSYMYIHCINYNNEIAITYYIPNLSQNVTNYYIDIFGLDSSNNIISRRGVQYLANITAYNEAYPVAVSDGCVILNIGSTKTLTYVKDNGNPLIVSETIDISQNTSDIMSGACSSIINNRFFITFAQQMPTGAGYTIFFAPFQVFNDSVCTDVEWSSKDAIALTSGTGSVDIGFAGITNADWISQGDVILSPKVCGIGVLNNVLQILQPSPQQACQIAYGSYDGTGQYGESNPNILEFDFVPKLVIVANSYGIRLEPYQSQSLWYYSFIWIQGVTTANVHDHSNAVTTLIFNQIGNTLQWYTTTNPGATGQMNVNGTSYYYIALG